MYYNTGGGWSGVFITKNNKNLEASIKFMEYLFTEERQKLGMWGREGIDWNMHQDGYPEFTYDRANIDAQTKDGHFMVGSDVRQLREGRLG